MRVEDFWRRLSAGVVNPANRVAVHIPLQRGLCTLHTTLTAIDMATMRQHLTANTTQDLVLYLSGGSLTGGERGRKVHISQH